MRTLIAELETEKVHADHMASMAKLWMQKAHEAEMMLAVAVQAAGGTILIHRSELENGDKLELTRSTDLSELTLRLTARKLPDAPKEAP